jgi:outer membrane lipopolysaccharide assembly protein LptE/RlpB
MFKSNKIILCVLTTFSLLIILLMNSSCGVYKLADINIPDSIKTIKVNYIENKARYINPQLSPEFTNKLRQKIVSQTRLTQVNNETAHYDIKGYISQYDVTTSAISNEQVASNRLTVGVHITLFNRLSNEQPKEFDISRSFEFSASLTLAQAEAKLNDEIIRNLTDEVFNRIFSDW